MAILIPFFHFLISLSDPAPKITEPMSGEEKKLWHSINASRKQRGLPEISASPSLNLIAQLHALELKTGNLKELCNLHFQSDKFGEKPYFYTSDHKEAACMRSKPREFSSHSGNGYEIAAFNSSEAADWLERWKGSPGHQSVIVNAKPWKKLSGKQSELP